MSSPDVASHRVPGDVLPADRQHDLGYMSPADFLYDALLGKKKSWVVTKVG
jgi:hypothetical protein